MRRPEQCGGTGARWIVPTFAVVMLGIAAQHLSAQEPTSSSLMAGSKVYQSRCVACHTIGAGVRIGPDLKGVTERRDVDWMKRFISAPDVLIAEGDSIATSLVMKYGIPMPNLGLSTEEVDAVVAFLGSAEEAPTAIPAPFVPTLVVGALAAATITLIALTVGSKKVEIRS